VHHRELAKEAQALKEGLVQEQFQREQAVIQIEQMKHELDDKNSELRELRTSWTEREKRIEQLETQRVFYEEELSSIGHQYQSLLDKLSYVVTDYSVRTAPIQVRVGGGYELLSTYLNRIFEDQSKLKDQYDKTVPHPPAVLNKPAYTPEKRPSPAPASPAKGSPSKEAKDAPWYEPLRKQQLSWAQGLRSPSPVRRPSPTKRRPQ